MNLPRLLFRLLLGRRLPISSGTLEVNAIKEPVVIRRDGYGIPCIEAQSDEDAWYGLGFCHGQDRAFQVEALLRVTRGTLAELIGPDALPIDRLSRRIGFRRSAEQHLKALDDATLQILEAYARGVNDGATLGCRRLAHEFALLRVRPTPYEAADAVALGKLLGFTAATNWDSELARLKILTEDGPEALAALEPAYAEWHPVISPTGAPAGGPLDRLADDLALFTAVVGNGGGSNSWAVAPSRTATGRPILANDPHLPPALPPYWYLAHVRTPQWAIAGASIAGAPGLPIGHNGVAAWGITYAFVDNTDLFIEEVGPDGVSVRQGAQFVSCEVLREVIQVKGQGTVEENVLVTPRGPIIGPALDGEVGAVSMRATWLEPRPFRGIPLSPRARSFEEFRTAWKEWPFASLNMVYADTSGAIGWQIVGHAPVRRKGWGTIPLPAQNPDAGWKDGLVPFNDMPHVSNPPEGFVATANNQPTPDGHGPFLGVDWIDGYRQARVVEALNARSDWDVASSQALQMDVTSLPWREFRDAILSAPAESEEARQAIALLKDWDGMMSADSPAAAIFELFLAEMVRRVVYAKAPRAAEWALGKGFTILAPFGMFSVRRVSHLSRLVREQPEGWFARPWPQEIANALATVVSALQRRYGDDPRRWAWGRIRPMMLRHPVGERKPLDRVFNLGPFPCGGDANTVAQAAAGPIATTANPLFIASLRMVVDVGNWDESRFALPGGQSGNPLSPHYADILPLWQRGDGVPIAWSPEAVDRSTRATLRLTPKA